MAGKIHTIIKGSGHCLPERVVDNEAIVGMMNTNVAFIEKRTGVFTRHHLDTHLGLKDLIIPAVAMALEDAQLEASDIDMLIVNTLSPDHHDPSEACLLQPMLGLGKIPAFDIRAQCSGLIYGMEIGQQFIESGKYQNILIVCGEVLSKRMDTSDDGRNLAILLGDGAGAIVLSASTQQEGLIDVVTGADGNYFKLLWTDAPGSAHPTFDGEEGVHQFRMNGKPMFAHAVDSLAAISTQILQKHQLTLDDVDVVIPHQPNMRILDKLQEVLQIPESKLVRNVDKFGNMASASLPITISTCRHEGIVKEGQLALIVGYGSGATWGAALYKF